MFIEFTTTENKRVLLNKNHIVGIEAVNQPAVYGSALQGGNELRIFATENRIYTLNTKHFSYESLREQLEKIADIKGLEDGQDKSSPIG